MPLTQLAFRLPPAFLARLGYRFDRRIVAVYWEPAGDQAAFTDDIHAWWVPTSTCIGS